MQNRSFIFLSLSRIFYAKSKCKSNKHFARIIGLFSFPLIRAFFDVFLHLALTVTPTIGGKSMFIQRQTVVRRENSQNIQEKPPNSKSGGFKNYLIPYVLRYSSILSRYSLPGTISFLIAEIISSIVTIG